MACGAHVSCRAVPCLKKRLRPGWSTTRRIGSCRSRPGSIGWPTGSSTCCNPFSGRLPQRSKRPCERMRAALAWLPWPAVMLVVAAVALRAGGSRLALFALATLDLHFACRLLARKHEHPGAGLAGSSDLRCARFPAWASSVTGSSVRAASSTSRSTSCRRSPRSPISSRCCCCSGSGPLSVSSPAPSMRLPPMVRNTMLGLELVPPAISEAGTMSGCTRASSSGMSKSPPPCRSCSLASIRRLTRH